MSKIIFDLHLKLFAFDLTTQLIQKYRLHNSLKSLKFSILENRWIYDQSWRKFTWVHVAFTQKCDILKTDTLLIAGLQPHARYDVNKWSIDVIITRNLHIKNVKKYCKV